MVDCAFFDVWSSNCGVLGDFADDDFLRLIFNFALKRLPAAFFVQQYQIKNPIMPKAAKDPITDPATLPECAPPGSAVLFDADVLMECDFEVDDPVEELKSAADKVMARLVVGMLVKVEVW